MRILITGADEIYRYSITHIIKLFYEDPALTFADGDRFDLQEVDLSISLELFERDEKSIASVLIQDSQGESCSAESTRGIDEAKQAVNIAFVQALTKYTKLEQPWGTLTGVRPLKLVHNRLQQGIPFEEIRKTLINEYLIHKDKVALMESIAKKQLAVIPDLYRLDQEVSIYIGIPFCPTKCAYCTFPAYAIQGKQGSVDQFLVGLHEEIQVIGQWLASHNIGVTSIYFGGGTPTSIEAHELDAILQTIHNYFPNQGKSRELTVEAGRPDTITPEKIEVMKKWNVDRISINPQSFTQRTLNAIGRHHTVQEVMDKYALAREMGMQNINMDLIIGLPGEGMEEYLESLKRIEELRPESVTVHTLSYKSASTMTKNKEKYPVASRETIAEMVATTLSWTKAQGYEPYYLYRQKNILGNQENVGYALPGKESIYNMIIMEEMQTIIGLGCGATSKFIHPINKKISRFANPKEPKVYIEQYPQYIKGKLDMLQQHYDAKSYQN